MISNLYIYSIPQAPKQWSQKIVLYGTDILYRTRKSLPNKLEFFPLHQPRKFKGEHAVLLSCQEEGEHKKYTLQNLQTQTHFVHMYREATDCW